MSNNVLIIGHAGSHGTIPGNTIASLKEAIAVGVDMVEFDVRLTSDAIPVLYHNFYVKRHGRRIIQPIRTSSLKELRRMSEGSSAPLATLDEALKLCMNRVMINIEIKEISAVGPTIDVIKKHTTSPSDWDSLLISSFKPLALRAVRKSAPYAQLGMLNYHNPFNFVPWHRTLKLTAVGFHRLSINEVALDVARRFELFTYVYTVNRTEAAERLVRRGIDGIVTDFPETMIKYFES